MYLSAGDLSSNSPFLKIYQEPKPKPVAKPAGGVLAVVNQEGGCDYYIGCGLTTMEFGPPITSIKDLKRALETRLKEHIESDDPDGLEGDDGDGGVAELLNHVLREEDGDGYIESVELYEFAAKGNLDLDKYRNAESLAEEQRDKLEEAKGKRALYEQLKREFGE